MKLLELFNYDRARSADEERLVAVIAGLGSGETRFAPGPEARVMGALTEPGAANAALRALAKQAEFDVEAVHCFESALVASLPVPACEEVLAGRVRDGDLVGVAKIDTGQPGPLLIGAVLRDGQLWSVFDAIALWEALPDAGRMSRHG